MKRFLLAAFAVAFVAGFLLTGADLLAYKIAGALGSAMFFTFVAWIVARFSSPRWGALAMGLTIVLAMIGR